jgi:multidrug resistance efflux pump
MLALLLIGGGILVSVDLSRRNSQKLADAKRQAEDTVQKLAKARAKTSHMVLRAPVAGTVHALSITSIRPGVDAGR